MKLDTGEILGKIYHVTKIALLVVKSIRGSNHVTWHGVYSRWFTDGWLALYTSKC